MCKKVLAQSLSISHNLYTNCKRKNAEWRDLSDQTITTLVQPSITNLFVDSLMGTEHRCCSVLTKRIKMGPCSSKKPRSRKKKKLSTELSQFWEVRGYGASMQRLTFSRILDKQQNSYAQHQTVMPLDIRSASGSP